MMPAGNNLKPTVAVLSLLLLAPNMSTSATDPAHDPEPSPAWIVDPQSIGPDIPPVGRSLFDFLVANSENTNRSFDIPFPFPALLDKIDQTLKKENGYPGIKKVLIPLGRSLQRPAARKEFFDYPRAVAVVDTEPEKVDGHAGILLKDRLYLGYHEKSGILEIISYNETAGRFEFQLVKNYHADATPELYYAPRAICTACHQNQSPIFSRPTWDETSANPAIKKYLKETGKSFYGFDLDHGIDIPNAIDDATDRANLFSLQQWLWRKGCGMENTQESIQCRAGLLTATLQYRLSGQRYFDASSEHFNKTVVTVIKNNWKANWPHGIAIPNPDIPNRNPFLKQTKTRPPDLHSVNLINVETIFEPIRLRPPASIWKSLDENNISDVIVGLSGFIASADIQRIGQYLGSLSGNTRNPIKAKCILKFKTRENTQRISFHCSSNTDTPDTFSLRGRLYLEDDTFHRCTVEQLEIGKNRYKNIQIRHAMLSPGHARLELKSGNRHIHLDSGDYLESIDISWQQSDHSAAITGEADLWVSDAFSPLSAAVESLATQTLNGQTDALSSQPFRRNRIMPGLFRNLGMPEIKWCCDDPNSLPAARLEVHTAQTANNHLPGEIPSGFIEHCAQCHYSREQFPPNFLYGDAETVRSNLSQCAERIFYRLGMWDLTPAAQPKTPMPPDLGLLAQSVDPHQWANSATLKELRRYISRELQQQTGKKPELEDFLNRDYEQLRICLSQRT